MTTKTTSKTRQRILLQACPRCRGDLFPELDDEDMLACLQCGRRFPTTTIAVADTKVLAPAA